jgi:DNA-binding PadR family transcriptional regulator
MADRLNSTAGALLGLLRDGPRSGYDLVGAAEEMIGGFWTITRSQVYRELAALADRGFLEKGPAGPRDRQPYQLTEAGRAAFLAWVNSSPEPENLRIPLLLRLTFASAIDPGRLRSMLSEHYDIHQRRLDAYQSMDQQLAAAAVPAEQRVTLAFGIGYETAVLDWFGQLPASMNPAEALRGPAERGS